MSTLPPFLPATRVVRVEFHVALPAGASPDEVLEWLNFELGVRGSIENGNPLVDHELEAIKEPTLTDTGKHMNRSYGEPRKTERGTSYSVREWLTDQPGTVVDFWEHHKANPIPTPTEAEATVEPHG